VILFQTNSSSYLYEEDEIEITNGYFRVEADKTWQVHTQFNTINQQGQGSVGFMRMNENILAYEGEIKFFMANITCMGKVNLNSKMMETFKNKKSGEIYED
jgi:hypothetical protein